MCNDVAQMRSQIGNLQSQVAATVAENNNFVEQELAEREG